MESTSQQAKLQTIRANLRQQRPDLVGKELDRSAYIIYLKKYGKTEDEIKSSLTSWESRGQVKDLKKQVLKGELSAEEYNAKKKEILPAKKNGVQKIYNDWATRQKDHPEYSQLSHAQRVSMAALRYKEGHAEEFRTLEDIEANPNEKVKNSKSKGPKEIIDLSADLAGLSLYDRKVDAAPPKPLTRMEQLRQQKK